MNTRPVWRLLPARGWYPGAMGLLFLILTLGLPVAQAATFTVTNMDDSGPGSLRQAILDANANLGADTIAFQAGLTGTITLTSGQIQITDALTLNGPGANVLAISGNNASRIFELTITTIGKVVTINGLTLKNGKSGDPGGAISTPASQLTINHCVLSDNAATNGRDGGAIFQSGGTLTINNSSLIANSASHGGAIIVNDDGNGDNTTLTVNNSTVAYNTAFDTGGGIQSYRTFTTINNSTMFSNSASTGGGILVSSSNSGSVLSLNNSTVSANSANRGGGIWFSGYYAENIGTLANSIVAGNIAPEGKEIYREIGSTGALTSLGHNLFGENGADGLVNVTRAETDFVLAGAIDTAIGELADNGGPTQTQAPVSGSPAINAGDNSLIPAGVTTDQRGFARIASGTVDIGAVEFGSSGGGGTTYALNVSKTGGNGVVTSSPTGINCGATCSASFASGVTVTLNAIPDSGYSFSGWSGACNGTGATCTVTMNAAQSVTALFANVPPSGYIVTPTASANGSLTPATPQTVNPGATVTFTVTANTGYIATVAGCNGTLSGNTYTTGPISASCTVVAAFSPTIAANTPTLTTPVLPDALVGVPYAALLTAISGQYPYTYTATGLPAGLTLTADGILRGIPTTGGAFIPTVTVTDALARSSTRRYVMTVGTGLALLTADLPDALINVPYTQTLAALGGQPPYLFTATGLPAGFSLSPSGALQGTPLEPGHAAVQLTVTDATHRQATQTTTLTVRAATFTQPNPEQPDQTINGAAEACPAANVSTRTLKLGDPGAPTTGPDGVALLYGLLEIKVTGCQPGQTVLALTTVYPEPLPPGAQYWKYGRTPDNDELHWYVLPGAIIQGNAITLLIVDGDIGDADPVAGNLLDPGGPGVTGNAIDGAVPAVLPISEPYRADFQARCDQGRCPANSAYDWSLAAGALPQGLTLTGAGATATLSGTPTQAGRYPFTVQALARGDSPIPTQQSYTLIITTPAATTLITHYYVSILEREPEADGLAYWQGLIADRQAQGIDVKPVFRDMANFFFNSPEYLGRNTTDRQFITNLYLTFFQREPDEGGYAFWLEQLASGMTRNTAMTGFLYSPEFTDFMLGLGF